MLTFTRLKRILFEMASASPKNRTGDYYYHITPGRNLKNITKQGLTRKNTDRNYEASDAKIYLAKSPEHAEIFSKYLSQKGGKENSLRVLRIRKDLLDKTKLRGDQNLPSEKGYLEYDNDIPAKDITWSGGKSYKKNTKKWRELTQTYDLDD